MVALLIEFAWPLCLLLDLLLGDYMIILGKILGSLGILLLFVTGGVLLFWEQLPIRLVLPYLMQKPIVTHGDVQKVSFIGSETGEQAYFAYLPVDYESGDQHYKTLYHLHGAYVRESWAGYECTYIGSKVEEAVAVGIIEPMIVICPVDREGDSMWSDSSDGQFPVSTAFTQDLIPHIDATYRTIAERDGRALQGFSMGGFGAVTNGFQSPELFGAIIIWDGALHSWETLTSTRKGIAAKMFETEEYFDKWSPYKLTKDATDVEPHILMVVGEMRATRDFGGHFQSHLENTGREFAYFDVSCPHSIFCLMDKLNDEAFRFLAASLAN